MIKLKGWPVIICGTIVFVLGYKEFKKGGGFVSSVDAPQESGVKEIIIDATNATITEIAKDLVEAVREGKESRKEVREQVASFTALVRAPGTSKRVTMCANNSLVSFVFRDSNGEALDSRNNMLLSSFKANRFLHSLLQTSAVGLGKNGVVNLMFGNVADFQPFLIGKSKPIINGPAMVELTVQQINGKAIFEPEKINFISGENKNSITGARHLEVLCGETVNIGYSIVEEKTGAVLLESVKKFRLGEENDHISLILEYLIINSRSEFEAKLPQSLASSFIKGIKTPVILKGIVRKSDE